MTTNTQKKHPAPQKVWILNMAERIKYAFTFFFLLFLSVALVQVCVFRLDILPDFCWLWLNDDNVDVEYRFVSNGWSKSERKKKQQRRVRDGGSKWNCEREGKGETQESTNERTTERTNERGSAQTMRKQMKSINQNNGFFQSIRSILHWCSSSLKFCSGKIVLSRFRPFTIPACICWRERERQGKNTGFKNWKKPKRSC